MPMQGGNIVETWWEEEVAAPPNTPIIVEEEFHSGPSILVVGITISHLSIPMNDDHHAIVRALAEASAGAGAGANATGKPPMVVTSGHGQTASSSSSTSPSPVESKRLSFEIITGGKDKDEETRPVPLSAEQKQPTKTTAQDADQDVNPEETRSKSKTALIMFSLGLAVFLAALDVTIITTALPTIAEHFHSSAGYTWIGSAYLLGCAASTPTWGKVSDIWGRKPMLLLANIVFFVGSLLCAISRNIGMLIAARAIQGIGGGGLVSLVNICISDLFSMRRRGAFYGVIGGVWALASAVGPLIGGGFTTSVSWRWCFYINLPLDGLAFCILLFFLDIPTPNTPILAGFKAIDWLGSLTVIGGTVMLLLGLEFGGITHPWSSPTVVCLIVFGFLTIAAFVVVEWKFAKYPVMPLWLFRSRSNIAVFAVCFLHGFVFIASSYFLPLYFQAVIGATPLLSGVYLLPVAISLSAASVGTGIIIKKTGKYLFLIWGALAFLTLGFGLFIDLGARANWAKIILYQIISGIGIGPLFQAPLIALHALVKPHDRATATATFGFMRNMGTSISVVIGGVVFQNQMEKRIVNLVATGMLSAANAARLGGSSAGASVGIVGGLPSTERTAVRVAFTGSLQPLWILYTAFAALALLIGALITKQTLNTQHETVETGLEAEERARISREEERTRKHASREGEQHEMV